jgi:hypothetical protein
LACFTPRQAAPSPAARLDLRHDVSRELVSELQARQRAHGGVVVIGAGQGRANRVELAARGCGDERVEAGLVEPRGWIERVVHRCHQSDFSQS